MAERELNRLIGYRMIIAIIVRKISLTVFLILKSNYISRISILDPKSFSRVNSEKNFCQSRVFPNDDGVTSHIILFFFFF
jgi:hypothetical protein